jgi:RHS repeat-associated protein
MCAPLKLTEFQPDSTRHLAMAKVDFYRGTTLIGTATSAPYSLVWNNPPAGNHSLTARATDVNLSSQSSTAVNVTVAAPPSITFTRPLNGSAVTATNDLSLTATAASGSVGSGVVKVAFYNGATLLGEVVPSTPSIAATPYTFLWKAVPAGTYTLTAQATDGLGGTAITPPITLTAGNPQLYFIHNDHLNTPRLITDTQARVVWRWDNTSPFGNNPPNENPSGLGRFVFNLRFAGQYADQESGLFYNHFRDGYSPRLGGYSQSDPIAFPHSLQTEAQRSGAHEGRNSINAAIEACRWIKKPLTPPYSPFNWHG